MIRFKWFKRMANHNLRLSIMIIFGILLCFVSCKNKGIEPTKNDEGVENRIFYSSEFYSHLNTDSISISSIAGFVKIKPGNFQVFKRTYTYPDDIQIADDEYTDYIYFQRSPEKTLSFGLIDEEITKANFYYKRDCFCLNMIDQKVVSGTITGMWMNGGCNVNANINLLLYYGFDNVKSDSSLRTINFSGIFKE